MIGRWKTAAWLLVGLLMVGGLAPLWGQDKKDAAKKPGTLIVRVPAEAQLEIDGKATKETGEVRRFTAPAAETHTFIIKVMLSKTGGSTRMRQARVQPGQEVEVDLRPGNDQDSSEIIFVPTPPSVVVEMLEFAGVGKNDVVYDLGCGDGRIVVTAAKKYGARGIGVDIDPVRVKEARELAKKEGVEHLVEIRLGDALAVPDIDKATVVATYMLPEFMARMEPHLRKNLKAGTRIVAHDYPLPNWKPDAEKTVHGQSWEHRLYLWRAGK